MRITTIILAATALVVTAAGSALAACGSPQVVQVGGLSGDPEKDTFGLLCGPADVERTSALTSTAHNEILQVGANTGEWTDFAPSSNAPLPAVIEITLTAIGQETAKRLENSADWTNTNSLLMKQAAQTLTTRINVGRKP